MPFMGEKVSVGSAAVPLLGSLRAGHVSIGGDRPASLILFGPHCHTRQRAPKLAPTTGSSKHQQQQQQL